MNEEVTVWQFLEKRLKEQCETAQCNKLSWKERLTGMFKKTDGAAPAMIYCGNRISRSCLIAKVERWSRMFRGMGIEADDKVAVFTTFIPEAVYAIMALNNIGARPVLLNTGGGNEHIAKGVKGAKYAVVARTLEPSASKAFRHNHALKRVVLLDETDGMPLMIGLRARIRYRGLDRSLKKMSRNYILSRKAMKRWGNFKGETAAEYNAIRPAFIVSSCGERPKLINISNGAALAAITQVQPLAERYASGGLCSSILPPFATEGLMTLFLLPLYCGMTCWIGNTPDMNLYERHILVARPQVCCASGRFWIRFFTHVQRMVDSKTAPDLSFFTLPMMYWDSVTKNDLKWMNGLLESCGCKVGICSSYGVSEMFSPVSADLREGFASNKDKGENPSVGKPLTAVAVMDSDGHKLERGKCGEICMKGPSMMDGYYRNDELTEASVRDGWFRSGDFGYIDTKGHLHVYGKYEDCLKTSTGKTLHPFEIEKVINADSEVRCCMVLNMAPKGSAPRYAAHIVMKKGCGSSKAAIERIDKAVKRSLPPELQVEGYETHRHVFKTTPLYRVDRAYYRKRRIGYMKPNGELMAEVTF